MTEVPKIIPWDKQSINRIKSIQEIDDAIEKIKENKNLNCYEHLHKLFFELFEFSPIPILFFEKELFKILSVYRGRPNYENFEIDNDITDPNTFSCPPWNMDNGFGRANWKARNVFYGSDSVLTALKETKDQYNKGNEIFLAKWGFDYDKLPANKIQVTSLVFDNFSPENPWREMIPNIEKNELRFRKDIGEDGAKNIIHLIKKLSKLFVELDKSKYPISAFISDNIIYSDFHKDKRSEIYFPILIYPSVETNAASCNFAIHPFFVKEYMKLDKVIHIILDEINPKSTTYSINKIGFCNDSNKIDWYSILPAEKRKITYQLESINCSLKTNKIDLNDIDKFIFKKNDKEITHQEIAADFLNKLDFSDFYKTRDILELDGIVAAIEIKYESIPMEYISLKIDEMEFENMTMDLILRLPLEYEYIIPRISTENQI